MTDIATLGLAVDAGQVKAADAALDKMAETGAKAEASAKKVTSATSAFNKTCGDLLQAIRENTTATIANNTAMTANMTAATGAATATNALAQAEQKAAATAAAQAAAEQAVAKATAEAAETTNALRASLSAMSKELATSQGAVQTLAGRVKTLEAALAAAPANELAAKIAKLTGSVQPFSAAADKANAELVEARQLFKEGAINADLMAQAELVLGKRSAELVAKQTEYNAALQGAGAAQRFTANETLNLSRQFQDVGVTLAMGMNPLMVLVQQGPQVYDVLEQAKNRGVGAAAAFKQMGSDILSWAVKGFQTLLKFITPTNIALAALAVGSVAIIKFFGSSEDAVAGFNKSLNGLTETSGSTARGLEQIARSANGSFANAQNSINTFVQAGISGNDTIAKLTDVTTAYAKATGTDAADAAKMFATMLADPAKAALDVSDKLGTLTAAEVAHVAQLQAQGDAEQAQAIVTAALSEKYNEHTHSLTTTIGVMHALEARLSSVYNWFASLPNVINDALAAYDRWAKNKFGDTIGGLLSTGNADAQDAANRQNASKKAAQDANAGVAVSEGLNTSGAKEYNDLLAKRKILYDALHTSGQLDAGQRQQMSHDFTALTDTINANRDATGHLITTQERGHLVAVAQAKLASAKTQTEKAAAQRQITALQLGTQVLTQTERETAATDAYNKVADKYVKAHDDGQKAITEGLAKLDANVTAQRELNDAILNGAGAELVANASRAAALEMAGKKFSAAQAEKEQTLQLALAVEKYIGSVNNTINTEEDRAKATRDVAQAVAEGRLSQADANKTLSDTLTLLPMQQVLAATSGDAHDRLAAAIGRVKTALADEAKSQASLALATDTSKANDQVSFAEKQLALIGETNYQRAIAIAQMTAEQHLRDMGTNAGTPEEQAAYVKSKVDEAAATEHLTESQNAYNDSLSDTANHLKDIGGVASDVGAGLADSFGKAGTSIGNVLSGIVEGAQKHNDLLTEMEAARVKYGDGSAESEKRLAEAKSHYDKQTLESTLNTTGSIIDASKNMFSKQSTGYKLLGAVEKAYNLARMAMLAVEIVREGVLTTTKVAGAGARMGADAAETASSVANSGARGLADGIAAFAKTIASLPFPANIAAGAAVLALLASVGLSIAGGGGGGAAKTGSAQSADDAQKVQGTGTVLGDASAKSDSIAHSLEIVEANSNKDLEFSNDMVRYLKNIDLNIGSLTSSVAKELSLPGGALDTSNLNLGTTSKGGLLGLIGGSTTTKELKDAGLTLDPASVADIIANGIGGSSYQTVETTKTKKGFLGIGGGTKVKDSTSTSGISDDLSDAVGLVVGGLRDSIVAASKTLGVSGADAMLDAFQINIGKISLKGMSAEEIQTTLEQVFSKVGDQMAAFVFSDVSQFQKAGEGAMETLVRLGREYQVVDTTMKSIGKTFDSVGISSVGARDRLVQLAGSLDDFTDQASFFHDNFLSEAEQLAPVQKAVADQMASLGLSAVTTKDQFKNLVQGLDVSTEAGAELYTKLMAVAPAFAKVADDASDAADTMAKAFSDAVDTANSAVKTATDTVKNAQTALQSSYNTAKAVIAAALDAANKAADAASQNLDKARSTLQTSYNKVLSDAQANLSTATSAVEKARSDLSASYANEAGALSASIDKMNGFISSLKDFRSSLDDTEHSLLSPEDAYNKAKKDFADISARAGTGDEDAIGNLQSAGEALLSASKDYNASGSGYFDDLKTVKTAVDGVITGTEKQVDVAQDQLNQLKTLVGNFVDLDETTVSINDGITNLQTAEAAADQAQTQIDLLNQQVAGLLDTNDNVVSLGDAITAVQAAIEASDVAKAAAAQAASDAAAAQAKLDQQVDGLMTVNDSVLSVGDAIDDLKTATVALAQAQAAATAAAAAQANYALNAAAQAAAASKAASDQIAQALNNANQTASAPVTPTVSATPTDPFGMDSQAYKQTLAYGQSEAANGNRSHGDYASYFAKHTDLFMKEYNSQKAAGTHLFFIDAQWGMPTGSAASIAKSLGLATFAQGGVFSNGVVSQPTLFNMGLMGEAGHEAIMPLVHGPEGLGVRAHKAEQDDNGNERIAELLEQISNKLDAQIRQQGAISEKSAQGFEDIRGQLKAVARAARVAS
jgi:phage-related minor tail protein